MYSASPAGEGIQIHVGPSSYTDQAALAPYMLEGGQENVKCFIARIPEGGFYYLKQENRMRPGSHHMLINLIQDDGRPEGPADGMRHRRHGLDPRLADAEA